MLKGVQAFVAGVVLFGASFAVARGALLLTASQSGASWINLALAVALCLCDVIISLLPAWLYLLG